MTDKNDKWNVRKNKVAVFYYILGIISAMFMLMILLGLFETDTFFWWQL